MKYKKRTSSILCCKIFAVEMANGILLSIYKELVENRCLFARQNGVIDCDFFLFSSIFILLSIVVEFPLVILFG